VLAEPLHQTGKTVLTSKPVQTEKPPKETNSNKLVKASFDVDATRLNLEAKIQSWASAWAAKKVNDYLGYYGPNFVPTGGESRGVWEANRRERINKAQGISITIEEIKFLRVEPTQAEVVFRQRYKSASISEESRKTLLLANVDGSWKIIRENAQPYPKQ
jgi:murein L,D-transpeptidase YafK